MGDEPLSPTKAKKAQRKRQRERLQREAGTAKKIAGAERARRRRAEAERDTLREAIGRAINHLAATRYSVDKEAGARVLEAESELERALAASVSKEEARDA